MVKLVKKESENKIVRKESLNDVFNFWDNEYFPNWEHLCNSYKGKLSTIKSKFSKSHTKEEQQNLYDQLQPMFDLFQKDTLEFKKKIDALAMDHKDDTNAYREIKDMAKQFILTRNSVEDRFNKIANDMKSTLDGNSFRIIIHYNNGSDKEIEAVSGKDLVDKLIAFYHNSDMWKVGSIFITDKKGFVDIRPLSKDGLLVTDIISRYLNDSSGLLREIKRKLKTYNIKMNL